MENADSKHRGSFIRFATPLCSTFQELPEIIDFRQTMLAVTGGVIVKHVHMYFTMSMFDSK